MLLIIFLWIALAVVVGILASGRGRGGFGWTVLACLISPLLAGIFLLVIADRSPRAKRPVPSEQIECPKCGGRILRDARVCWHCGGNVGSAGTA